MTHFSVYALIKLFLRAHFPRNNMLHQVFYNIFIHHPVLERDRERAFGECVLDAVVVFAAAGDGYMLMRFQPRK